MKTQIISPNLWASNMPNILHITSGTELTEDKTVQEGYLEPSHPRAVGEYMKPES